jgi:hypothetical protein
LPGILPDFARYFIHGFFTWDSYLTSTCDHMCGTRSWISAAAYLWPTKKNHVQFLCLFKNVFVSGCWYSNNSPGYLA